MVTFCFDFKYDEVSKKVIDAIPKSPTHKKIFYYIMKPKKNLIDHIRYAWLCIKLKFIK